MKCEIYCCTCFRKCDYLQKKYPGEHTKIVIGNMRTSAICDHCGCDLKGTEAVAAVSTWNDELAARGRGYYPWEDEFIIPVELSDRDFANTSTGFVAHKRKEL